MHVAIVCCHYKEPTGWMKGVLDCDEDIHIYVYDCGVKPFVKSIRGHPRLHIEDKSGMLRACDNTYAYFHFCVKYYHKLPEFVFFMHGHDIAWHQPLHVQTILELCRENTTTEYINVSMSMHHTKRAILAEWVTDIAKGQISLLYTATKCSRLQSTPSKIIEISSAQARVSRCRILSLSQDTWKSLSFLASRCVVHSNRGYAFEACFHRIMGEEWDRSEHIRSTHSLEHDIALPLEMATRRTRRSTIRRSASPHCLDACL